MNATTRASILADLKFREKWWRLIEDDPEVVKELLAAALVISTVARRDGTRALISNRRLSEILGVSERTAQRLTQRLRALEYLELAERGGRRGDGTITANVYDLSLPTSQRDTQVTGRDDDSQHDTQVAHWDDSQHDKSASQHDKTDSQHAKTGSQHDTQVADPSLNPSFIPPIIPSRGELTSTDGQQLNSPESEHSPKAHSGSDDDDRKSGKDHEKQKRLDKDKPTWRCKGCGCHTEADHDRLISMGIPEHPWLPIPEGSTRQSRYRAANQ